MKRKKLKLPALRNPMQAQLFDPSCRAARRTVIESKKAYRRNPKHKNDTRGLRLA